jgi:hypothetical protein
MNDLLCIVVFSLFVLRLCFTNAGKKTGAHDNTIVWSVGAALKMNHEGTKDTKGEKILVNLPVLRAFVVIFLTLMLHKFLDAGAFRVVFLGSRAGFSNRSIVDTM